MPRAVYLDHAATTPVAAEVLTAMLPFLGEHCGNPSSQHASGRVARNAIDEARVRVAAGIGCAPREIVFTAGGTEADNLALRGVLQRHGSRGRHLVVTSIEHDAVLKTAERLAETGHAEVTVVDCDGRGVVDPDAVAAAVRDDTILVSVMLANNEVGTVQDVTAAVEAVKRRNPRTLIHSDAVQALGKLPVDVAALGVDLLTVSAHKVYGPKGVGALYVRRKSPRVRIAPMLDGGGHERGMRSGTLPVPLIVGFGKAAEICRAEMEQEGARLAKLRDRLQDTILSNVDEAFLNGHPERRLPHNLNISFAYVEG